VSTAFTRIDPSRFGPWAIITGSSSGIGAAFARQVAASGLNVVLLARRGALLEELGRGLQEEFGVQYRAVVTDLTQEDFLTPIQAATDDLDIGLIISNAGGPLPGEFLTQPIDTLLAQVRLDVAAPFRMIHYFGPRLVRRGKGGVILVSAMGAVEGLPLVATSSAGKAFVESLGRSLHGEFTKLGVNTTVLIVGPTDTQVIDMMGLDRARMPIKPQSATATAAEGLAALIANRPAHLSGRINRLVHRVVPASLTTRMARGMVEQGVAALARRPARSLQSV
jgi:short-subunit dehydrogenase